jgi:hypothetical protein
MISFHSSRVSTISETMTRVLRVALLDLVDLAEVDLERRSVMSSMLLKPIALVPL